MRSRKSKQITEYGNGSFHPGLTRIELFDGQHRARGLSIMSENFDVRHYQIGIHLTLNGKTLQPGNNFFSDINNASKPAASINMAYDSKINYLRC